MIGKEKTILFSTIGSGSKNLFEAYDLVLLKKESKPFVKNFLKAEPMKLFEQPKPLALFKDIGSVLNFVFEGDK